MDPFVRDLRQSEDTGTDRPDKVTWKGPGMDYSSYLDDDILAFIAETERHYPPDAVNRSIAEQRSVYDTLCRAFHHAYPEGIETEDTAIAGVPVRRYVGGAVTLVYFHGGGFVVGGLESHDDVCAEICARTGATVVSVDYRLAPEHRHPAMFEDALAVTRTILADGLRTVLAGDSAGGNLAAAVSHRLRASPGLAGQVLIYPGLGGDMTQGSYLTQADAPLLTTADVVYYGAIRCDGPAPENDPSYAPLQDSDFAGVPPTIVFSAECDPLCDDGRVYCSKIQAAGGRAQWILEDRLVHGYLRARHSTARARASFDRIIAAIARLCSDESGMQIT